MCFPVVGQVGGKRHRGSSVQNTSVFHTHPPQTHTLVLLKNTTAACDICMIPTAEKQQIKRVSCVLCFSRCNPRSVTSDYCMAAVPLVSPAVLRAEPSAQQESGTFF